MHKTIAVFLFTALAAVRLQRAGRADNQCRELVVSAEFGSPRNPDLRQPAARTIFLAD